MRSLSINEENLKNQKEAVKQERRLSFDNQPYATAIVDVWPTVMYRNWQSSHSLIGSFEDLNASSVEDVSKFFKTYYAPDNAALVIVGDIQPAEAKKLIETYFGDILITIAQRPDLTDRARIRAVQSSEGRPGARARRSDRLPGPQTPFAGLLRLEHDRRDS